MEENSVLNIKSCLISVSDKVGIVKIANRLSNKNIRIISTGNTFKELKANSIKAERVEHITKFPEILDGRVKTLHPKIFGGILGDINKSKHLKQMQTHNISKIEMVIVNLYPFEEVIKKKFTLETYIENIDIGGPSIIRAAAKNYFSTVVLTAKQDYQLVMSEIDQLNGVSLETRKILAYKAFSKTMEYDLAISKWFSERILDEKNKNFYLLGDKPIKLRYGENPHQNAELFNNKIVNEDKFYNQLNGKDLSYNNFNDLHTGLNLVNEFKEPACVIIKHAIPCGVSESKKLNIAWLNAFSADQLSAFGGVVTFNRKVDEELAKLISKIFLEVIAAPAFSKRALEYLKKKVNLRILKIKSIKDYGNASSRQVTMLANSFLIQDRNKSVLKIKQLKFASKKRPNNKQLEDLIFASKVVKYVRSNAIVIAKNKTTIGIGSGNTSRVDSVNFAIKKSSRIKLKVKKSILPGSIMASDAFFPFADSIKLANKHGIVSIIQPGGSINDKKIIDEVDKSNMSMVFTGKRSFSH